MSRQVNQVLHRSLLLQTACFVFAGPSPLLHAQTTPAATASLSLAGPAQQSTLSLDALKALPHVSVTVTDAHTHQKETYTGVALVGLLEKVGAPAPEAVKGKVLADYIVATGSDNYHAVLSLAEIEPGFHPGTVIVADTMDGKPIDTKHGPLKLIVEEDQKPARWVRNLVKLELKSAE